MSRKLRLGVNIDHVATVRNARGIDHPHPVRAAEIAQAAGADGITAHLREDRRHIRDDDIERLMEILTVPLNLEMAATEEMLKIALRHKPHAVCIVPEKREELTTEGGLDVVGQVARLHPYVQQLKANGSRVSLFIDPDKKQIDAAVELDAPVVELHTGSYCDLTGDARAKELDKIQEASAYGHSLGIEVHAGHGLSYETVTDIAAIPELMELNIGHFLIGEAIFIGLDKSIKEMRRYMDEARASSW
ncbi:pyridoxine 5'-phosphate synthase [Temperatibacter marinus]|uniref:Pyridoxine 5'-phosphate synthase n=1 Tax=Temperatibacter marinus TaxID=1456591 RepID=A0AA52EC36_9PROT|nr:pyridoxine 5'-phosphate synthase [Temperatibacter marinus]WND01980.1 pyridoxine 5'-phosphate synthase [Temperatibacter marinus]